jgi:twitching motility protein PilU
MENRPALLQDLSASLRCVVSQRLVRNAKGERTPAVEVMLNSRHVADLIEAGEVNQIKEAMEKSLSPGSQTFEQALFGMYRDGVISKEEALANADSANNLMWLMNNTEAETAPAPTPKTNPAQQAVEQTPGGTSYSEFKLNMSDEKAA